LILIEFYFDGRSSVDVIHSKFELNIVPPDSDFN